MESDEPIPIGMGNMRLAENIFLLSIKTNSEAVIPFESKKCAMVFTSKEAAARFKANTPVDDALELYPVAGWGNILRLFTALKEKEFAYIIVDPEGELGITHKIDFMIQVAEDMISGQRGFGMSRN